MKILIDTYGADQGEKVLVDGAIACQKKKDFTPVFIGNKEKIEELIAGRIDNYEIIHTNNFISNDDDPQDLSGEKKMHPLF